MKQGMHNGVQSKNSTNVIFDVWGYYSNVKNDMMFGEIPQFGSGVVKAWLHSENLKKILRKTDHINKKYSMNNIIKAIEEVEKPSIKIFRETHGVLEYSRTDAIIWERIFGFSVLKDFEIYIVPNLKNIGAETDTLIKEIMKYHGEYIRSLLVKVIGYNLNERVSTGTIGENENIFEEYARCLEEYRNGYNWLYEKMHDTILDRYSKNYSTKTAKKIVERRVDIVRENFCPTMVMTPIVLKNKEQYVQALLKQKEWKTISEILSYQTIENKIPKFCFEYEIGSFERNEFKKVSLLEIEKSILDSNRIHYNWKNTKATTSVN